MAARLTVAHMNRVAGELRQLIGCATEEESKEPWFGYACRLERDLAETLATRECPRVESGQRLVIEATLSDGRAAELTYEVEINGGTRPEPSCGWVGGPELEGVKLVRVTVGDEGVAHEAWGKLVPKEAEVLAEEAAEDCWEQLVYQYRENAS